MTSRFSPLWLAVGAVFSGASTYVLLVVIARAVGPAEYGRFSLFWAAIVVTSLGAFLPVEQMVARHAAHPDGSSGPLTAVVRQALRRSAVLAVVAVVVVTAVLLGGVGDTGTPSVPDTEPWLVAAFAVAAVGFAAQFAARGVLAGLREMRHYAVVIAVDAGGRVLAAVLLLAAGVESVVPYAMAVGGSCLACGVVGLVLVRRALSPRAGWPSPHGVAPTAIASPVGATLADASPAASPQVLPPAVELSPVGPSRRLERRQLGTLIVAALCMQTLLNSAVLVVGVAAPAAGPALAGHLLAVLTLARIPVFVFQSAQAAYVGRIAGRQQRDDRAGVARLLVRLAAVVLAVGGATVAVAVAAGPAIVPLVFGPDYDVSRGAVAVVALGVAAYLAASVANDVAVAVGAPTRAAPAWIAGTVCAVAVALLVPDTVLRATLPLLVGSVVAGIVLVPLVVAHSRTAVRPW